MPERCQWPAGCAGAVWANPATGRRRGLLICDECNKAAVARSGVDGTGFDGAGVERALAGLRDEADAESDPLL